MWDSNRDTNVKNRLLDFIGEGEGGMIWESNIEPSTLPYMKQIAASHCQDSDAVDLGRDLKLHF